MIVISLLAGAAVAGPPAPAPATWADWVGDWSGKLRWTGCTTSGAATAKLPIDAVDGAMSIDLAPAGAALASFGLVEDDHGWAAQQADVSVGLARRGDAVELAVRFDSGCALTASLQRATTGLAACDRLAALARIESKCTKLAAAPLEDPTALARERDGWRKARGGARGTLGEQCALRASRVETELVDAGCAPHADPLIGVRAQSCLALAQVASKLLRCARFPRDAAQVMLQLAAAAETADAASLPIVERQCRDMQQQAAAAAARFSCAL